MEFTAIIMILFGIVVVFPIATGYLFYCKWRKYLWLAPIIILIIAGLMFINDVSHNPARSFIGNVKSYFENGVSYGYLLYIPTVGISFISTIVLYIYDYIVKRRLTEIK